MIQLYRTFDYGDYIVLECDSFDYPDITIEAEKITIHGGKHHPSSALMKKVFKLQEQLTETPSFRRDE